MKADRVRINDGGVQKLKSLFHRRAWRDSPSCPCGGVDITFRSDKRELTIYPAGDGCPTMRVSRESKNYYFYLTDDQNAVFKEMMGKYGVEYPFGI